MSINNTIDSEERIVYTTCTGEMNLDDFKEYIANVWSDSRYLGYNELFDTTQGDWSNFNFSDLFAVAENSSKLTSLSPDMKFAWVVLEGKQKKLTEYYKTVKSFLPATSRKLEAFYDKAAALQWLKS